MTSTDTHTGIPCSACGRELTEAEVRLMWADTDFVEHDGHYAGFEPTPENFKRAREIAARA
jgi:hypothetical protein